ncbi:hypothetical protein PAPHI01_0859 [Pancytospora philotis]|nr:hypothetical protein PAPHI01_0859 [Pancytospora philotis]
MLLFLFACLALCSKGSYSIKQKTDILHRLTGFSTFYDYAGIPENAPAKAITKTLFKLKARKAPANLTEKQHQELVGAAMQLLGSSRPAYDAFLANSNALYIHEGINYKNHLHLLVLFGIAALLIVDCVVFAVKYTKFCDQRAAFGKAKKAQKQSRAARARENAKANTADVSTESAPAKLVAPVQPKLFFYSMLLRVKKIFIK